jgi:type I restriction enzyme S subunit
VNSSYRFEHRRLKYAATINDEALGEDTAADYVLEYVDIGNVDSSGKIHEIAPYSFEDAPSRARRIVRDGDVIISTVRTYLQAIAPVQAPPDNLIVSTGFAVIRPRRSELTPNFCKYALRESAFLLEVEMRSVGVSYPAINASEIGDIRIHLPSLRRQQVIAGYLDRETARLDQLVAAKERVLELLAEKRRSVITDAVTRGVDDRKPMKESGVEWLGRIPAEWKTRRVKYLFHLVVDAAPADNDFELLALYTDVGVRPRRELQARGNKASTTDSYWLVRPGDLVVNKLLAWMGAFGESEYQGVTSPAYDILRPQPGVNTTYYHHLFRCGVCFPEFRRRSTGIMDMRLRLYFDRFGDMRVPLPPIEEQRAIVAHIATETAKLDAVRAATERTVMLLKERRAALIDSAVTGRIELENAG